MVDFIQKDQYCFDDLCKLVAFLRSKDGCSWDQAQTHQSIRRNFLEEAYEACEGLDRDDPEIMCEEFGDVLLQVLFHTDIERERGRFTIDDVCDHICKKLVYRHPHLFGGEAEDWEELKRREKGAKTQSDLMDDVARSLPALIRAEKLHEKAAKADQLADDEAQSQTIRQSLARLLDSADDDALGDLLLAAVGIAARHEMDSESALHSACERYIRRVKDAEQCDPPGNGKE